MSNTKKIIQITVFVIVVLAVGYYFINEFYLSKTSEQEFNVEEMLEFKLVREDFVQEQIDDYQQRFEKIKNQILASGNDFNFSAFNSLGMIKKALYDFEGAKQVWEYANIKSPKNSLSFFNLGILYMDDLKDNQKAEENFLIVLKNSKGEKGNEQYYRIIVGFYAYYYPEKKAQIEKILLDALKLENYKDNVNILALLAAYYQDEGQKEKALEYWERALVLDPENEAIKNEINNLK